MAKTCQCGGASWVHEQVVSEPCGWTAGYLPEDDERGFTLPDALLRDASSTRFLAGHEDPACMLSCQR